MMNERLKLLVDGLVFDFKNADNGQDRLIAFSSIVAIAKALRSVDMPEASKEVFAMADHAAMSGRYK